MGTTIRNLDIELEVNHNFLKESGNHLYSKSCDVVS